MNMIGNIYQECESESDFDKRWTNSIQQVFDVNHARETFWNKCEFYGQIMTNANFRVFNSKTPLQMINLPRSRCHIQ